MTKSKAAFLLSAETLFRTSEKVYFWTFTFRTVKADWEANRLFSAFLNELRKALSRYGFGVPGGLKVSELHKEHGVHFHVLINVRVPADMVRFYARKYGIGRVHAAQADMGSARYMAKYLSKQRDGAVTETGRKARRWATFGSLKLSATRVGDLVNDSPMWVYRRAHNLRFLGFWQERLLIRCWDHGEKAMHAAWAALADTRGRTQDACGIAECRLTAAGVVTLVESMPKGARPF